MKLAVLCLALALGALCPLAGAATIQVTQGGWDQGGPLSITFEGVDSDLSGGIDTAELTAFSAEFQTACGGTALWTLADLGNDGFYFGSANDFFIKADGPEYSLYEISIPGGAIGLFSDALGGSIALTDQPFQVSGSTVPEPGTALLIGLPLLGLGLARRRLYCGS
ncbi:hypothetical protein [uncultured Paludibaculum sp.]|uniref:hypothetical protein n=1 Tax=uncultured Paludibaculum sp. TaxID=1765020 RepID=UPI002AAA8A2F|nr:hypothetical protein [uncultured Paludibaculum sp.]